MDVTDGHHSGRADDPAPSDPAPNNPAASDPPPSVAGVPFVPGYRTGRLLGFGSTGEVWAAEHEPTGEPVALKVLRRPDDDADRLLAETALLRRVHHPHLVRLREVARAPGYGPALVLDRAPGGSLAALVAARGQLDVEEVVTLVTPLGGLLAELHEQGLVHADVAPGNVLFGDDGRPLLGDLSAACLAGVGPLTGEPPVGTPGYRDPALAAGDLPTPASDVHGLAAVAWFALTGRAPEPVEERLPLTLLRPDVPDRLATVLHRALDPDPGARPDPRDLAAGCFAAAPALPVRIVASDPAAPPAELVTHRLRRAAAAQDPVLPAPGRRSEAGTRRRRRAAPPRRRAWAAPTTTAVGAVALVAVLAGAVLVPRLLDGDGGGHPSAPAPAVAPVPDRPPVGTTAAPAVPAAVDRALRSADPVAAVPALAWLRARALTERDERLLQMANVPGGPAAADDAALWAALAEHRLRLDGLGFDVRSAEVVEHVGDRALLEVHVTTSAHRRVGPDGQVVGNVPAQERTTRLELLRHDGRWQVVASG